MLTLNALVPLLAIALLAAVLQRTRFVFARRSLLALPVSLTP